MYDSCGNYFTSPPDFQLFGFISVISGLAAIWSLTLLTMERTWVIHSITKNRTTRMTMAKMRSAVIIIWAAAIITALAPLFGWNKYVYEVSTAVMILFMSHCQGYLVSGTIHYMSSSYSDMSLVWVMIIMAYMVPNLIIIGGNIIIFRAIKYSLFLIITIIAVRGALTHL